MFLTLLGPLLPLFERLRTDCQCLCSNPVRFSSLSLLWFESWVWCCTLVTPGPTGGQKQEHLTFKAGPGYAARPSLKIFFHFSSSLVSDTFSQDSHVFVFSALKLPFSLLPSLGLFWETQLLSRCPQVPIRSTQCMFSSCSVSCLLAEGVL